MRRPRLRESVPKGSNIVVVHPHRYHSFRTACPQCQGLTPGPMAPDQATEMLPCRTFFVFTCRHRSTRLRFPKLSRPSTRSCFRTALIHSPPRGQSRHLGPNLGMDHGSSHLGHTLQHHPHVHCVRSRGGPSLTAPALGGRFRSCFFLPDAGAPRLFSAAFLAGVSGNAFAGRQATVLQHLASLADRKRPPPPPSHVVSANPVTSTGWSTQAPIRGPEQVLARSRRYTHPFHRQQPSPLARRRRVRFTWKD